MNIRKNKKGIKMCFINNCLKNNGYTKHDARRLFKGMQNLKWQLDRGQRITTKLNDKYISAAAAVEDTLLNNLPSGISILTEEWDGETERMTLGFAVSHQAITNKRFDLSGFIKDKFNKTLTAIRHMRRIKELRLTHRFRMVIDPFSGHKKTQIYIHIEYAI